MSARGLNRAQQGDVKKLRQLLNVNEITAVRALKQHNWDINQAADALMSSGSGASMPPVDESAIVAEFARFADNESPELILEDGISAFCDELGIDPSDIVILVIAYNMEAAEMCVFTKEEFVRGMTKLRVDSVSALKGKLPELRAKLDDPAFFHDFYEFTFKYSREAGQKNLPRDIAVALWKMLLEGRSPLLDKWINFIENVAKPKMITHDTWALFLQFSEQVGDDLSKFDEDGAWPVLIDDFVDHLKE